MKTLALYSIKGGVGKTSAAVNLAWIAAERGARILLWDLDPQAATTWFLRVRARIPGGGRHLLHGDGDLRERVLASDHPRLDLLPAALSLRKLERRLERKGAAVDRIACRLDAIATEYDYVVLDCPPGISLMAENVFEAADALVVPLIPSPLSVRTLHQLIEFLVPRRWDHRTVLPFFSMVDRRKSLHRELVERLSAEGRVVLPAAIPNATEVERMGVHRAPLVGTSPRCAAARAYEDLHDRIERALYGDDPVDRSARALGPRLDGGDRSGG